MKVIFNIVVLLVVIVLGIFGYRYWHQQREENGGEVQCVSGCPSAEEKAAFARKNSGGDDPGMISGPVPARPVISPMSANGATQTAQGSGEMTGPAPVSSRPLPPAPADFPASKPAPVAYPVFGSSSAAGMTSADKVPARDSIIPNPPNGSAFSGTGQFLLYRQGSLTWELNTSTGRTCIKFATLDEWRKAIVLRNGCGHAV